MDLSVPFAPLDATAAGPTALLVAAAARAAGTPTALAQARLPARADPADAAFDQAVAATIAAWRATKRIE